MSTSRRQSNNLGRVKIDRRGILTVKSILDDRSSHIDVRDRRPHVNQRHFVGVERRRSSNTFNSELNTFRSNLFFFFKLFVLFLFLINCVFVHIRRQSC